MGFPLTSFLKSSRSTMSKWKRCNTGMLHLVMGNEAADADSIIGSLVYSYLLYSTIGHENSFIVPLLQIENSKLRLRCEVLELLKMANINEMDLLSIQEYKDTLIEMRDRVRLHLVDHNVLSTECHGLEACVTEIIDHRLDEGFYPSAKRMISYVPSLGRGVGSCCTLIAQEVMKNRLQEKNDLSLLLEGVILLDTAGLSPSINKTTEEDIHAVEGLDFFSPVKQKDLYQTLLHSKFNQSFWSTLSVNDALQYDYKLFHMGKYRVGWSNVLTPLSTYLSQPRFNPVIQQFMNDHSLDSLILSSLTQGEKATREFKLIPKESIRLDTHSVDFLLQSTYQYQWDPVNQLWSTEYPISRKQLAPQIAALFI